MGCGAYGWLVIFPPLFLLFYFLQERDRAKYRHVVDLLGPRLAAARQKWGRLYYCHKCDGVFLPRSPLIAADDMTAYLLQDVEAETIGAIDDIGPCARTFAATLIKAGTSEGLGSREGINRTKLVACIVTLYPQIKAVQRDLESYFTVALAEAEQRTAASGTKAAGDMQPSRDVLRETSILTKQVILFMDVIATGGAEAVNKAAPVDPETIVEIHDALTAVFVVANNAQGRDKVGLAYAKIMAAHEQRERVQ